VACPFCIAFLTSCLTTPAWLAHVAQKTADPLLNEGFEFTQTDKKARSVPGVALCATIQALFKRGGFLGSAKWASTLPGWPDSRQFISA